MDRSWYMTRYRVHLVVSGKIHAIGTFCDCCSGYETSCIKKEIKRDTP